MAQPPLRKQASWPSIISAENALNSLPLLLSIHNIETFYAPMFVGWETRKSLHPNLESPLSDPQIFSPLFDDQTALVIVQYPISSEEFLITLNCRKGHEAVALLRSRLILSLVCLSPPGEFGADIVVGEGQSLGLPLSIGVRIWGFSPPEKIGPPSSWPPGGRNGRQKRKPWIRAHPHRARAAYSPRESYLQHFAPTRG